MQTAAALWLLTCLLVSGLLVAPTLAQEAPDAAVAPGDGDAEVVSSDAAPAIVAPVEPIADPAPAAPAELAAPPALTCGAPANPWGYSYCGGSLISSPPATLCTVFACISTFWRQVNGYVIQCRDGLLSHSGGVRGSCSTHGGNSRPLYAPG
jgi:hypothetical protein